MSRLPRDGPESATMDLVVDAKGRSAYWPYGMALAGLAILVLGVLLGVVAGVASRDGADDRGLPPGVPDPAPVVLKWDRAFRGGSCEAFRDTTTAEFRADYGQAEADYSTCDGFEDGLHEIEDGKPDDFWKTYDIEILEVRVDGDYARVETEESWEYVDDDGDISDASTTYTYDLVLTDDGWLIDDASFLHEGDEMTI